MQNLNLSKQKFLLKIQKLNLTQQKTQFENAKTKKNRASTSASFPGYIDAQSVPL